MQENAAIIEKKLYYKEWRARNKERIRDYNTKYWEQRATRKSECEPKGSFSNDYEDSQGQLAI